MCGFDNWPTTTQEWNGLPSPIVECCSLPGSERWPENDDHIRLSWKPAGFAVARKMEVKMKGKKNNQQGCLAIVIFVGSKFRHRKWLTKSSPYEIIWETRTPTWNYPKGVIGWQLLDGFVENSHIFLRDSRVLIKNFLRTSRFLPSGIYKLSESLWRRLFMNGSTVLNTMTEIQPNKQKNGCLKCKKNLNTT